MEEEFSVFIMHRADLRLWHFQVVSHAGTAHLFNEPLMVALIKAA